MGKKRAHGHLNPPAAPPRTPTALDTFLSRTQPAAAPAPTPDPAPLTRGLPVRDAPPTQPPAAANITPRRPGTRAFEAAWGLPPRDLKERGGLSCHHQVPVTSSPSTINEALLPLPGPPFLAPQRPSYAAMAATEAHRSHAQPIGQLSLTTTTSKRDGWSLQSSPSHADNEERGSGGPSSPHLSLNQDSHNGSPSWQGSPAPVFAPNSQDLASTPPWVELMQQLPTRDDLRALLSDVTAACKEEISSLRQDIKMIASRVEMLEDDHDATRTYLSQVHPAISAQMSTMQEIARHLEDLDNRGRRNNVLGDTSPPTFKLDRAHRALRPKGSSAQPRDVICCFHDHQLKEAVMEKARRARSTNFQGSAVQLYQDLSWITLQKRRLLKPLLAVLQEHRIPYRWNFPFALTARRDGRSVILRSQQDLPAFCQALQIPVPKVDDWDLPIPAPPPPPVWHKAPPRKGRMTGHPSPSPIPRRSPMR